MKLLDAARLQEGSVCEFRVGELVLAVCHTEGRFYAVSGVCPHAGGPIGQGAVHGHSLVCPWHAWEFDCRTGQCDFNTTALKTYAVQVVDGAVVLDA